MEFVKLKVKDYIGIVTIDRPPVNAINTQLKKEIRDTFLSINERDDIRVVILNSTGDKAFIAGNDLHEFKTLDPKNADERSKLTRESFWAVYDCRVPVIAAIDGPALGSGLAYAAVCDMIIASENATFGLPEINVGVMGGARHLSRLVPHMVARYMHYTGITMTAKELKEYGAIIEVVPRDKLMEKAIELAASITEKSPVAIRFAKESLNTIEFMDLKEGYKFEQSLTKKLSGYEDSKEAVRAFLEKRKPNFTGK